MEVRGKGGRRAWVEGAGRGKMDQDRGGESGKMGWEIAFV